MKDRLINLGWAMAAAIAVDIAAILILFGSST